MKNKLKTKAGMLKEKLAEKMPAKTEHKHDKIRVLHVLTDKNIGGAGRWLLYYLKYHNREEFDVRVVLPLGSQLIPAVKELGVHVTVMAEMEDKYFPPNAQKEESRKNGGKGGDGTFHLQYKALHGICTRHPA